MTAHWTDDLVRLSACEDADAAFVSDPAFAALAAARAAAASAASAKTVCDIIRKHYPTPPRITR